MSGRFLSVSTAILMAAGLTPQAMSEPCHPTPGKLRIERPSGGFSPPAFKATRELNNLSQRFLEDLRDPPMCLMVLCNGSCLHSRYPCRLSTHLRSGGFACAGPAMYGTLKYETHKYGARTSCPH